MQMTWKRVVSIYMDNLENGNEDQKKIARSEINALAESMDAVNASNK